MTGDLFKQYKDWIDWSQFDGLPYEEQEAIQEKNRAQNGLNYILKPDAPESAKEAWKQDALRSRRADKEGIVVN